MKDHKFIKFIAVFIIVILLPSSILAQSPITNFDISQLPNWTKVGVSCTYANGEALIKVNPSGDSWGSILSSGISINLDDNPYIMLNITQLTHKAYVVLGLSNGEWIHFNDNIVATGKYVFPIKNFTSSKGTVTGYIYLGSAGANGAEVKVNKLSLGYMRTLEWGDTYTPEDINLWSGTDAVSSINDNGLSQVKVNSSVNSWGVVFGGFMSIDLANNPVMMIGLEELSNKAYVQMEVKIDQNNIVWVTLEDEIVTPGRKYYSIADILANNNSTKNLSGIVQVKIYVGVSGALNASETITDIVTGYNGTKQWADASYTQKNIALWNGNNAVKSVAVQTDNSLIITKNTSQDAILTGNELSLALDKTPWISLDVGNITGSLICSFVLDHDVDNPIPLATITDTGATNINVLEEIIKSKAGFIANGMHNGKIILSLNGADGSSAKINAMTTGYYEQQFNVNTIFSQTISTVKATTNITNNSMSNAWITVQACQFNGYKMEKSIAQTIFIQKGMPQSTDLLLENATGKTIRVFIWQSSQDKTTDFQPVALESVWQAQ